MMRLPHQIPDVPEDAMAQARQPIDTSADNLMVVLRESMGENKTDETLRPQGKLKTKLGMCRVPKQYKKFLGSKMSKSKSPRLCRMENFFMNSADTTSRK